MRVCPCHRRLPVNKIEKSSDILLSGATGVWFRGTVLELRSHPISGHSEGHYAQVRKKLEKKLELFFMDICAQPHVLSDFTNIQSFQHKDRQSTTLLNIAI